MNHPEPIEIAPVAENLLSGRSAPGLEALADVPASFSRRLSI